MNTGLILINLFVPLFLLGYGFMLKHFVPGYQMGIFGYVSEASRKNEVMWHFAQLLYGKQLWNSGKIIIWQAIFASVVSATFPSGALIQTFCLLATFGIVITMNLKFIERALKENFNEDGEMIMD